MAGTSLQISNQYLNQLNQFAHVAYGVKNGYGKSGGLGVMMMDDGCVVKTKTRWFKNIFSTTRRRDYQLKTQMLRKSLGAIIVGIRKENAGVPEETKAALAKILADLGLNDSGNVLSSFSKKLLSRKTVAKVLNKLDDLTGAGVKDSKTESVWGRANETATSLGTYRKTTDANGNMVDNGKYKDKSDLSAQHTKREYDQSYVKSQEILSDDLRTVGIEGRISDDVEMFQKSVSPAIVKGLSNLNRVLSQEKLKLSDDLTKKGIKDCLDEFFSDYRRGLYNKWEVSVRKGSDRKASLRSNPNLWIRLWEDSEVGYTSALDKLKGVLQSETKLDESDKTRVLAYLTSVMDRVCREAYKCEETASRVSFGSNTWYNDDFGLKPDSREGESPKAESRTPRTFMAYLSQIVDKCVEDENDRSYTLQSLNDGSQEGELKAEPSPQPTVAPSPQPKAAPAQQAKGAQPQAPKAAPPEKPDVQPPIELDHEIAHQIETEYKTFWKPVPGKHTWNEAFSSWTLKAFMKGAEQDLVAALRELDEGLNLTDADIAVLRTGYESQKADWEHNEPLWHGLLAVGTRLLEGEVKSDFNATRAAQARMLVSFFREAGEAAQMKGFERNVAGTGVQPQTEGGNTCSIISTLNAILVSGPEKNAVARGIMNPKKEDGKSYYEFPGGANLGQGKTLRVDVDELDKPFPENLLPNGIKKTAQADRCQEVWKTLTPFEKAALLALNRKATREDEKVVPGETTDYYPVADLFGFSVKTIGRLALGLVPKGEFELHAAEVVRALRANRTCVLGLPGHFVAITGVTFGKNHEPQFSYVESSGGPKDLTIDRQWLQNGYQLYIESDPEP